jgi:hypothetical protein
VGFFGSFTRLVRAPLSVLRVLARPRGRFLRLRVLAPRLLLLYPRRRQLSLQLSTPLGDLPGLAIASSLPGYGGAGGVDGWAAALIGRRRLAGWLSLNRRGAEETHGLLLAYKPAGRELGGGLLVQRCRV